MAAFNSKHLQPSKYAHAPPTTRRSPSHATRPAPCWAVKVEYQVLDLTLLFHNAEYPVNNISPLMQGVCKAAGPCVGLQMPRLC